MRYVMDSSFLTGCELVDTQHGQLFDAINGLMETCEKGADIAALQKSLDFLSDYTVKHFFDEEQLLRKNGFTDLDHHHQYHEAFKKTVRDLTHQFILGGVSEALVKDIQDKIGAWLVEHIKGQDFRWAGELKDKAPGMFAKGSASTAPAPAAVAASTPPVAPAPAALPAAGSSSGYVMDRSFLTGCEQVDSQHRQLFDAINALLETCRESADMAALQKSLDFLSDYTVKHFFDEEQILTRNGYSDLANHKRYHEAFKKTVRELSHEFILKGASAALIKDIQGKIGAWLVEHIKGQDFRWAGELKDKAPQVFAETEESVEKITAPPPPPREAPHPAPPPTAGIAPKDNAGLPPVPAALPKAPAKTTTAAAAKAVVANQKRRSVTILAKMTVFYSVMLVLAVSAITALGLSNGAITILPGRAVLLTCVFSLAVLAAAVFASRFALGLLFNRPVKRISGVLSKVGEGDIALQIRLPPGDEIGEIAGLFDRTLENLKRLVMIIQNEAEAVDETGLELSDNMGRTADAMNEINAGIKDIQAHVSGQANSLAATNETMERITSGIDKLNTEIEVQTSSVSQSSSAIEQMLANIESVTRIIRANSENVVRLADASAVGRTSLQAVADDMQEIARESEGLLEINSVLQNIASQTNLLSMNAAIEAAHAGEAGKGFAVVADEIRKLAESSGEQSKTISTVLKKIRDSITKISTATGEVLNKFGAIESDVRAVSEQEEHIRSAMEEQSAGSKQILDALGRLNDISRTVKTTSGDMQAGSREIINEEQNLRKVTSGITAAMTEIADRAGEVNEAVAHVNSISAKSSSDIAILKDAISHFMISDRRYSWDDSLAVGNKKIDEQHQQLISAINSFMDAIEEGRGAEQLQKSLNFLVEYTATHFADEEVIQKQYDFPEFENHHKIHEGFKEMAGNLAAEFQRTGGSEALVKEVKRKFGDWLITHIKVQDLKIGEHIRKVEASK